MNVEDKGTGKQVPYIIHAKVMCVSSRGVLQPPLGPQGQRGSSILKKAWNMFMVMCKDFQSRGGNTDGHDLSRSQS